MARQPLKPDEGIAAEEIVALRARLAAGQLQAEDFSRLDKLLAFLLSLLAIIENRKVTIKRLQRLLFGPRRDTRPLDEPPAAAPSDAATTAAATADEAGAMTATDATLPPPDPSEPAPNAPNETTPPVQRQRQGHGRRPAAAYPNAPVVNCQHTQLQAGGACPLPSCTGHLHDTKRPQKFIRLLGHPPITATRYEQQVLRCGNCQQRFPTELPAGVTSEKYNVTADVALVINKYGSLTPWERQASVQQLCRIPLAATTQWERCEAVANALLPVWQRLQKAAAQADLLGTDDTRVQPRYV